jgi:hypothetical protein
MNSFRFTLESGSRRYTCPQCNQKGKFKRYIDNESGTYIADIVGRCDRENNCDYHLKPKEYFERYGTPNDQREVTTPVNSQPNSFNTLRPPKRPEPTAFNYIEPTLLRKSLNHYDRNNLYLFLCRCFGEDIAVHVCARYLLGTSKYIDGSSVFWYIDSTGKVTDGKIMYYDDPKTGKRYKGDHLSKPAVNWVHSLLRINDFNRKPCFYGEHLLKVEPAKPVLIVESEKTALIASVFFHDRIILATGGQQNLTDRLYWELFQGRQVQLIPDTAKDDKAFKEWKDKAEKLNKQFKLNIQVSDFLNNKANETDKEKGEDLADFLTKNRDNKTGLILFDGSPVTWEYFVNDNDLQKYNDKQEDYYGEG